MEEDDYIYLPDWWTPDCSVPLSHILCNNSPIGIGSGNSSWLKNNKRLHSEMQKHNQFNLLEFYDNIEISK